MRTASLLSLIALLFLGAHPEPAWAETVYKWVDDKGTVHFGPRPPLGVDAVPVRVDPGSPAPAVTDLAPAGEAPEAEEPQKTPGQLAREERKKRRAELAKERRQLELQCEAMRQQLAWVEPSPRVLVETEDGGTRRLEDDERMELVNEARSFIEQNCQ